MTAVITDVRYRMAVALIRDLGSVGIDVIACEREKYVHSRQTPPLGFFSKSVKKTITLPNEDEAYLDALYETCADIYRQTGEKPALLAVGAKTLAQLAKQETHRRFSSVAGLCLSHTEQLDLFNDKAAVHRLATQLGVAVPQSLAATEQIIHQWSSFPCVVKPLCGEKYGLGAAQRYKIVSDRQHLADAAHHFQTLTGEAPLVQEYLPGAAYGCSAICQDGELMCVLCHQRLREYPVSGGPSSCCRVIDAPHLVQAARALVAAVRFTGPVMFEFKADANGKARLLEINPRVWGSYPLARVAGSGMSFVWFALSYNNGNPKDPVARVSASVHMAKKCVFSRRICLRELDICAVVRSGAGLAPFPHFFVTGCGNGEICGRHGAIIVPYLHVPAKENITKRQTLTGCREEEK